MKTTLRSQLLRFFTLVFVFGGAAQNAHADLLNCRTLPSLMRAYLSQHVMLTDITKDVKTRTVDQYMKIFLDPSKTQFLQKDAEEAQKALVAMFDSMEKGDCSKLTEYNKLLLERAKDNEAFAKKFLDDKYTLDNTVELVIDPKKRGYPTTKEQREDMLKKFFHFQISNYLIAEEPLKDAKANLIHRYELVTKRVAEKTEKDLISDFMKAFASALDPHTAYLSADDYEDFRISMSLSLEGIGAQLSSQDGFTVVEEIIVGGAADRAGTVKRKDKIIAVGQGTDGKTENVIDMPLRDVVKLIRGKKGSTVRLIVLRKEGGKTNRVEIALQRDKVDLKDEAAKLTYETRTVGKQKLKIAVIDLPSFYGDGQTDRSCYTDMKKLVEKAAKAKADGLVLNLARNGGGLLEDAVKIAGLFIKQGGVVATQTRGQRSENTLASFTVLPDTDPEIAFNGPMVVVTSRQSASASEILAGALKNYQRALIVGSDHTFGKGTVQAVIPLRKGMGSMKVTTGMFFVPSGQSTQQQGVNADVVVPSIYNSDEIGEKFLDFSLPPQNVKNFVGTDSNMEAASPKHWIPVDAPTVAWLSKRSEERVSKSKDFDEIRKELEEAKKDNDVVKLAEVKQRADKHQTKRKKREKQTQSERVQETDGPLLNEAINVMTDFIAGQKKLLPVDVAEKKESPAKTPGT